MKALAICFGIAVAIVATVALTPVSGWVFKNELDLAQDQKKPDLIQVTEFRGDITPSWVKDPSIYNGSDFSEQLAHTLLLDDSSLIAAKLQTLAESHPNEPLVWILLARYICMRGSRMPGLYANLPESPEKKQQYLDAIKVGREACLKGAALEPNNAYFTLVEASLDASLGLLPDMKNALRRASSQSKYDSHLQQLELVLQKAQLLAKGYRGEFLKNFVGIPVVLPEFTHISYLGRFLSREGDLHEKRDIVQASWLMTKGADLGYEMIQAASFMKSAIGPPEPKRIITNSEWIQMAKEFDHKLRAAHLATQPTTLDIYLREQKALDALKTFSSTYSVHHQSAFWEAIRSFEALLGLTLSILLGGLAFAFQRIQSEVFRRMLPHLVSFPLWLLYVAVALPNIPMFVQPDGTLPLRAGFLFAILQVSVSFLYLRKRYAVLGCSLVVLVSLATTLSYSVNGYFAMGSTASMSGITLIASIELLVLAWFLRPEKRNKLAPYLGGAVVLLGILSALLPFPLGDASAIFGCAGFAITPLLTWNAKPGYTGKFAQWSTTALFILAPGGAGIFIAWEKLTNSSFHGGYLQAVFLILFFAMLFAGKSVRSLVLACCASWIIYSGIYLATVGMQVRGNHEIAMAGPLREGDAIRQLGGI